MKRTLERDTTTDWLTRVTTLTRADTTAPDTIQDDRCSYDAAGKIIRVLDAASAVAGGKLSGSDAGASLCAKPKGDRWD